MSSYRKSPYNMKKLKNKFQDYFDSNKVTKEKNF